MILHIKCVFLYLRNAGSPHTTSTTNATATATATITTTKLCFPIMLIGRNMTVELNKSNQTTTVQHVLIP